MIPSSLCGRLLRTTEVLITPKPNTSAIEVKENRKVNLRCVVENRLLPDSVTADSPALCVFLPLNFPDRPDVVYMDGGNLKSTIVCQCVSCPFQIPGHFFISKSLALSYSIKTGFKFQIWKAHNPPSSSKFILEQKGLPPESNLSSELVAAKLKNSYLMDGMTLKLVDIAVSYSVSGLSGVVKNPIQDIKITSDTNVPVNAGIRNNSPRLSMQPFPHEFAQVRNAVFLHQNIYINGPKGCGKSNLVHSLFDYYSLNSIYFQMIVSCSEIDRSSFAKFQSFWNNVFIQAERYEPSIIYLDDVHCLISSSNENGELGFVEEREIAFLQHQIINLKRKRKIIFIGFGEEFLTFSENLVLPLLFQIKIALPSLAVTRRKEILTTIFQENFSDITMDSIEFISVKTEGYLMTDLVLFVKRLLSEAFVEKIQNGPKHLMNKGLIEKTLKDFVPLQLRKAKFVKSSIRWIDIAGMQEAKEAVRDIIESPVKYSLIYKQCRLRLPTGILLFGYPGCGKTYLASAISSTFPVQFISIKGPELLDKYIGKSEQGVRDLFSRAQMAKPCVLFFDEFDSVAPRRGQDSTGVTDRVVNQILTQMDGAESLDGVYIVAATTRPDMIDPALLRPGRLDKLIFCDLPNEEERLEVLQKLANRFHIENAAMLKKLSTLTDGYTYADLSSLLYDAHLIAVHKLLKRVSINAVDPSQTTSSFTNLTTESKRNASMLALPPESRYNQNMQSMSDSKSVVIEDYMLMEALKKNSPSLNSEEFEHLSNLYRDFRSKLFEPELNARNTDVGSKTRQI